MDESCLYSLRCFVPVTPARLVHFVILVAAMLWMLEVLEVTFAPVGQWVLAERWRQVLLVVVLVAAILLQAFGVRPPWLT